MVTASLFLHLRSPFIETPAASRGAGGKWSAAPGAQEAVRCSGSKSRLGLQISFSGRSSLRRN